MNRMAIDALNRGWSLGFATGKVQAARESDFGLLVAGAGVVHGSRRAAAAGFRRIVITVGIVGFLCSLVAFGPALFFGA